MSCCGCCRCGFVVVFVGSSLCHVAVVALSLWYCCFVVSLWEHCCIVVSFVLLLFRRLRCFVVVLYLCCGCCFVVV